MSVRSVISRLAILGTMLSGCQYLGAHSETSLSDYLNGLGEEFRVRDEKAWLRCFALYKNDEPFVISVMADEAGKASMTVHVKTSASSGASNEVGPTPGIKFSSSIQVGSENSVDAAIIFLDPGHYPELYKRVKKVFDGFSTNDVCWRIPSDGTYTREESNTWPAVWLPNQNSYFAVDDARRPEFYKLIERIHALPLQNGSTPLQENNKIIVVLR